MKSHAIALSSLPSLSFPRKRGSRATGITFTLHGISVCKILFVPLTRSCRLPWAPASAGMTSLSTFYPNKNQVPSLSFSLENLNHHYFQKIFFIFPRTAVRFRGNDNEWKENDIGGGRDRTVGNRVFGLKVIGCMLLTLLLNTTHTLAAIMPTTANGSVASHAQLSTLCTVRKVQEGILSAGQTIRYVLKQAENKNALSEGLDYTVEGLTADIYFSPGIHEGAITGNGLAGTIDSNNGIIIFTLTPSDVHPQAPFGDGITLTYIPEKPNTKIVGWTCKSTAGHLNYSPSWNPNPSETSKDPITVGLGYPFYGCTYDPIET